MKVKEKAFWNNTIRSITISYLETAIQVNQKILLLPAKPSSLLLGPIYGIIAILVAYPSSCVYWLATNRENLKDEKVMKKFGKLYNGIATYRNDNSIFYYPVYIFRRLIFVLYPIIFEDYAIFQIGLLVFSCQIYLIWFGSIKPYFKNQANIIESFNEFMLMIFTYHLFIFSNWTYPYQRIPYGNVYLGCIGIMLLVNVINVVNNTIEKVKTKRRRAKLLLIG